MTAGAADWSATAPVEARRLLRAARSGTLATVMDGQPFASLVTPAVAADGAVLLLLSGLSEHTRHLKATPRCSLLVLGDADGPNPQTTPHAGSPGIPMPRSMPASPISACGGSSRKPGCSSAASAVPPSWRPPPWHRTPPSPLP